MIDSNSVVFKNKKVPWRIIESEAVLVNIDGAEVIHLDEVAAQIWRAIDGNNTLNEIVDIIYNVFEAEKSVIQKDTVDLLSRLLKKGIISVKTH